MAGQSITPELRDRRARTLIRHGFARIEDRRLPPWCLPRYTAHLAFAAVVVHPLLHARAQRRVVWECFLNGVSARHAG